MRRVPLVLATLGLLGGCAKELGVVEASLGETTTIDVDLPAGPIHFPMAISRVEYDQAEVIMLRVEVLRAGEVVGEVGCRGLRFVNNPTKGFKSGNLRTSGNVHCTVDVPGGGADQVRVATRFDKGTGSVEGLRVFVAEGAPPGAALFDAIFK